MTLIKTICYYNEYSPSSNEDPMTIMTPIATLNLQNNFVLQWRLFWLDKVVYDSNEVYSDSKEDPYELTADTRTHVTLKKTPMSWLKTLWL